MRFLKINFYVLFFIVVFQPIQISAQIWNTLVTATSNGPNEGVSVSNTEGNSLLFAGNFKTNFSFLGIDLLGNSNYRGFWGKATPNGQVPWLKYMHSSRDLAINNIDSYNEFVAVSGYYSDTLFIQDDTLYNENAMGLFVAIYDTLGNYLYTINPNVYSAEVGEMKFDEDGYLYVVGDYYKTFDFDSYSFDSPLAFNCFLLKYDVIENELIWMTAMTEGSGTIGSGLDIDDDHVYVIGSYGDDVIFEGVELPNNNANHNFFTAKYDKNGNLQWVKTITGLSQVHGTSVAVDKNGNTYFTGDFQATVDSVGTGVLSATGFSNALLGKYDENGQLIWLESIGGIDQDNGVKVALDSLDSPVFLLSSGTGAYVGSTSVEPYGFMEPLIIKLHPNDGSYVWHKRITATQDIGTVQGVDMFINGHILFVIGRNRSGIEFEFQQYPAPNNREFFIAAIVDTIYVQLPIDDLSLHELDNSSSLIIYPNPSSSSFTFNNLNGDKISSIKILDTSGKQVIYSTPNVAIFTLEENLSKGLYYCEIVVSDEVYLYKIVKL